MKFRKILENQSFLNAARHEHAFSFMPKHFLTGQILFYLPESLPSFYYWLKQTSVKIEYIQFNSS